MLNGTHGNDVIIIYIARGNKTPLEYRLGAIAFSLFDWEEDGSVGSVAVPVNISNIFVTQGESEKTQYQLYSQTLLSRSLSIF